MADGRAGAISHLPDIIPQSGTGRETQHPPELSGNGGTGLPSAHETVSDLEDEPSGQSIIPLDPIAWIGNPGSDCMFRS